jgi:6-bladed beta-propeller protein
MLERWRICPGPILVKEKTNQMQIKFRIITARIKAISICLGVCVLASLTSSAQLNTAPVEIRLDPTSASGGNTSDFFDPVEFVMLEQNPRSAFGKIDQLEVRDGKLLILDKETNCILIFTSDGTFVNKIEGNKLSSNKNARIYYFFLNNDDGSITIPFGDKTFLFSTSGVLIKTKKETINGVYLGSAHHQIVYDYSADKRHPDSNAYEVQILKNGSLIKSFLPYNLKHAVLQGREVLGISHLSLQVDMANPAITYFRRSYDYSIYHIEDTAFTEAYKFIFPLNMTLPKGFRTDSTIHERIKFLRDNPELIYSISNFYKIDSKIIFKLTSSDLYESFIYDEADQTVVSINKISPDSIGFYFPVTDAVVGGVDFKNSGILNFDGFFLYSTYSANQFFSIYDLMKEKKISYPRKIQAYLSNPENRRSNPILVKFHLKKK